MCEDLRETTLAHRTRWLGQATDKTGLPAHELLSIYNGITAQLLLGEDWPPTDPYRRALQNLGSWPGRLKGEGDGQA